MSGESLDIPSSSELIDGLLSIPGSTGETYRRFWNYSPRNIAFLALQGCPPEPVATFAKWKELGGHVIKGSKAYSILRPINIKVETNDDDEEQFKLIRRYKIVKALFAASQTSGAEIPPYEPAHWSIERALKALDITQVPFQNYDGNMGGYSVGRTIAINPVAPFPLRTTIHEISHVAHGDTTQERLAEYQQHRGAYEFRAEASAYVCLNELGELDEATANVSRGYVQHWIREEKPPEDDYRRVLNVSSQILNAGYESTDNE